MEQLRELNKFQSALFFLGGALMVIGVGCFVFMINNRPAQQIASFIFLTGGVLFAVIQCMQTYQGSDLTLRRLKSIMNMGDLFFVLSGVSMVDTATGFLRPMFTNLETYYEVIYNKWVVLLLIAVVLELYTTHRITHEMSKHKKNEE